ncbi:MAG: hypothetical protein ACYDEV_16200 [Acidiferrobacter sp.]
MARFRKQHGLLGQLSCAIPGMPAPAGSLGQGQHGTIAGALLRPTAFVPENAVSKARGLALRGTLLDAQRHFLGRTQHFALGRRQLGLA